MITINIGDYVETIDGEIGYVIKLIGNYKFIWECGNKTYDQLIPNDIKTIKKHYRRIGSYDFTIKENKVEYLGNDVRDKNGKLLMRLTNLYEPKDVIDKINEIIYYINKEDK